MRQAATVDIREIDASEQPSPQTTEDTVLAARAAGAYLNHTLNNSLQAVLYRAELLSDHEDPQVAEAGRYLAQCVKAMADTVKMVGSIRRYATVTYLGAESMLDPSCLEVDESWSS